MMDIRKAFDTKLKLEIVDLLQCTNHQKIYNETYLNLR